MGYTNTKPSKSTGPKSDAVEKPFEKGNGSPMENKRKAAPKAVITFLEKGQPGGNLYGAADIPDGEWSVNEITARTKAQGAAFVEKYQTTSMGDGDKAPIPGDKLKPTPAVVKKY